MKDYAISNRALDLAARRAALRAHCELQRSHLGATMQDIEAKLAGVDRVIATVQRFAHRPLLVIAGVGLVAAIGPGRLMRLASRSAFLFATSRRLLSLMRR